MLRDIHDTGWCRTFELDLSPKLRLTLEGKKIQEEGDDLFSIPQQLTKGSRYKGQPLKIHEVNSTSSLRNIIQLSCFHEELMVFA